MNIYSVTITKQPLGIELVDITNESGETHIEISAISPNSIAEEIGLSVGDKLIAIKGKSALNISSCKALKQMNCIKLPFKVTFRRYQCGYYQHIKNSSVSFCVHNNKYSHSDHLNVSSLLEHTKDSSLSLNINHHRLKYSFQEQDYNFLSVCKLQLQSSHFVSDSIVNRDKFQYDLYMFSDDENDENDVTDADNDHEDNKDEEDEEKMYLLMDRMNLFDVLSAKTSIVLLSTKGFNCGYHEWSIKILKCDVFKQEIGIISNNDINVNTVNDDDGVKDSKEFGARAIYGNELSTNKTYYASFNEDNKERINKDLSNSINHSNCNIGWCTNDIIKVCMDLDAFRIKFYLNDQKVRKTLSLQNNKTYYPILWFSGNCQYELVNYK